MKNMRFKQVIWTAALVSVVAITAFIGLSSSQSSYNAYGAPSLPLDGSVTPSVTLPPGCIPFLVATLNQKERTATPIRGKESKTEQQPTATAYPITQKFDLSPNLPDQQKSTLLVFRCNGNYEQYLAGPEVAIPTALELQPGDRIIQSIPPTVLVGAKPVYEPKDSNPYPPPENSTPTPISYPYP